MPSRPLQNVEWPGVLGVEYFQYATGHGGSPGTAILRTYPQIAQPAEFGNLTWYAQDGQPLTLADAHMYHVDGDYGPDGQTWTLYIHDERWKWRTPNAAWGSISGNFNQRDSRGELRPKFIRSPEELAVMCFEKMGVTEYGIYLPPGLASTAGKGLEDRLFLGERFPPSGTNPNFVWDHTPPVEALQQVAETFGCRLVFQPFSRLWLIVPLGYGMILPDFPMESQTPSLNAPEVPAVLAITGAPMRAQFRCRLMPVGEEWHGYPVFVDDLSYAPGAAADTPPNVTVTGSSPATPYSIKVVIEWGDDQGLHHVEFHDSDPAHNLSYSQRFDAIIAQFNASPEAAAVFAVSSTANTLVFTPRGVVTSLSIVVTTYLNETPNPYTGAASGKIGGDRSWANCQPPDFVNVRPTDRLSYQEALALARGSVWKWFRIDLTDPGRFGATNPPPSSKPKVAGRIKDKVKKVPKTAGPKPPDGTSSLEFSIL